MLKTLFFLIMMGLCLPLFADKEQEMTDINNYGEWSMERHDPQMTGHTLLKGKMDKAPEVIWRYYLGLWSNYLVIKPSKGTSQTIDIPKGVFGENYLHETASYWDRKQPQVDIDGKGTLVNLPNDSSSRLAKLLPNVSGYQRVEFDNAFSIGAEANFGRMYAYDEGADKPRLVWQTERIKDMYSPVVAIADTDLDGQDEVILLTHYHLAIYDALTGKLKNSVEWNVGRNYGQLDVIDIDHDRYPDFVIQADTPPHIEFIQNSPKGASLVWSHKYLKNEADVAVPTDFALNNLPNAVCDLDGDGRIELAVNIRHFKDDRQWHVVIFDVMTGEVKNDIIDRYLWAVADIDSDGYYELFLSEALDKTVDRDSNLFVMSYTNNGLIQRWESQTKGNFCMKPYRFPITSNSASSRGPVHHSTIITNDVDDDGFDEFFVSIGKELHAIGIESDKYQAKFTVTSPSEKPPKIIATSSSNVLVELFAESGAIHIDNASAQLQSHYQTKGFRTTPSVADIDKDGFNEIVVENGGGFIEAIRPNFSSESKIETLWKFKAYAQPFWVTWKANHAPVPLIDLDGDGKKEIICSDAGNENYTTIYALCSDGSIYWKSELPDIAPRLTETFRVGRFRPEGFDIIVTIMPTTQPEMLCLDGRTGEIRWHKKSWMDDNNRAWPYPNAFVCYDSDGDGLQEIYGSYAYIYYQLDGKTGESIHKPIHVVEEIFHRWQSYFYPIPADFNGDGKDEFLLASLSFAMGGLTVITKDLQILWEKPLPNTVGASGIQGIGDCDGDGIPEIAFFHLDGHIACYDGKTGEIQWRIDGLTSGSGHFTSADIDSDGRDEFLYSLGTNEIIALDNDAPNNILWRAKLPATSDTPVIADIDNDGLAEIIVCTSDGYINILK
jgi:hypothetical protein